MKQKWLAILMALLMLALAACGTAAPGENDDSGEAAGDSENASTEAVKTVYGEIAETTGANYFTLKLIEVPEGFEEMMNRMAEGGGFGGDGERRERSGGMPGRGEMPEWDGEGDPPWGDGERPNFRDGEFPEGSELPEGFDPENMPEGGRGPGGRQGGFEGETQYTGEEIEVIVPVGIPIVTTTRGENGIEETEVNVDSLKAGDALLVSYGGDDSILKVTLMQNMMRGMGGMRPPQGQDGQNAEGQP